MWNEENVFKYDDKGRVVEIENIMPNKHTSSFTYFDYSLYSLYYHRTMKKITEVDYFGEMHNVLYFEFDSRGDIVSRYKKAESAYIEDIYRSYIYNDDNQIKEASIIKKKDGISNAKSLGLSLYKYNEKHLIIEEKGSFPDYSTKSVQLVKDRETGNLVFKMVVDEEVYGANEYDNVFSVFPINLSKAFDTIDIDLHLTDDVFETQRVFLYKGAPQSIMALATEIRFTPSVTREETQKLANYLIKEEFSDNKYSKTILLDKEGDTYFFKMVMADTNFSESIALTLHQFGSSLSKDVFNKHKVLMRACDDNLNAIKVVK